MWSTLSLSSHRLPSLLSSVLVVPPFVIVCILILIAEVVVTVVVVAVVVLFLVRSFHFSFFLLSLLFLSVGRYR